MKIKICPKCGSHNVETASVCANQGCGQILSDGNIVEMNDDVIRLATESSESSQLVNTSSSPSQINTMSAQKPLETSAAQTPPESRSTVRTLVGSCLVLSVICICLTNVFTGILTGGGNSDSRGAVFFRVECHWSYVRFPHMDIRLVMDMATH